MTSCSGGGGQGTQYTYAQLEGLWIAAGGSKALAPTMAAIAEAESGGCSSALNSIQACGLWQIHPYQAGCLDAATNAKMAVGKYQTQGLTAWTTYTSGAYKAYVNGSTTPDPNVPGPNGSTTATLTSKNANPECLFGFSVPGGTAGGWISGALGAATGQGASGLVGPSTGKGGGVCLLSRTAARAILGGGILVGGLLIGGLSVILLAAYGLGKSGALGKAADAAAVIPGGELAAAGLAAAHQRTQRTGSQAATRRSSRNAPGRVISHEEIGPQQLAATRRRQTTKVVAGPNATAADRKAAARSAAARGEEPPF